ncbi:MAG TPA: right-handed parallel beta-helix repeat-containing protein [Candidatus Thalassarchaeaceae archaeon]|nr:right-handed parallel beta-helix repeat-containing protein [Candidatus Thalassarchaeaceae archaeon]|tara:strand:- start:11150 stop:15430 length:4281 start_codon:yes stop_codon:yes gene_type:complete
MAEDGKSRPFWLSGLFLLSIVLSLALPAGTVMASNETTEGTITGTETWAGTHTLTGDVSIAPGAKLIIHAGSTVIFANGSHLDVRGSLCAGAISCGSPTNAGPTMRITLKWEEPANSSATGECYGMSQGNQEIWIDDPSCNEGVLMRSSIDLSETELRYVTFDGAWGVPHYISAVSEFRYGALVLDGASPVLTELEFSDINTSSVLTTNLAQPTFNGGNFIAGNDESRSIVGPAIQIYSSGSSVSPFLISDITITGTGNGCQNNAGGRHGISAEKSFVEIENTEISSDYGIGLWSSAGKVSNTDINVNCNGIDINGKKSIGSTSFGFEITNNQISTQERSGIYVSSGAYATLSGNEIQGASQSSGIVVYSSEVSIHNNNIGPIGGFNGFWLGGTFDVVAENNSIFQTARTPIVAGWYTSNNNQASASRVLLANNSISYAGDGGCSSNTHWGGDFTCPVLHAYMTGVTMYDNVITAGGTADGIRSVGSLLDIQRNSFTIPKTGAVIRNYDSGYSESQQYGSLAYFSQNTWDGVEVTYNITKSSVTVQSEHIPSPPSGDFPVKLSWPDQEAWPDNGFQGAILPTPVKECDNCADYTPRNFPLSVNMDNNSTVFTFANLTNLDLSKVKIATQPTHFAVQVSRAELVRFQTLINGEKVSDAMVIVEDAIGKDLYLINTGDDGFTPWIALPSNFHLDFRGLGGGNNPDGFADDQFEDSCSDGIDNDGDLYIDIDDSSCDSSAGTREMSLYRYTAYKFGFGYSRDEFTLQEATHQETTSLVNLAPTVIVSQEEGHSFRRVVNITGSAHDGQLANSYSTDELAQWDQRGYVHSVQVKDPFTGTWEDAGQAVDISGMPEGMVTRFNRPFSSWYYEIDLSSLAGEGDYTFEFRAFDGIEYSSVVSRTIKLNAQPPTIFVTSPSSFSSHDTGSVQFVGSAQDPYGCPLECNKDIGLIYMQIEGPNFLVTTPLESNEDGSWEWSWDFSTRPKELATYTFTIWASDSDFCKGHIDECQTVVLTLSIDNSNSQPTISVNEPYSGTRISSSIDTLIQGVARDFDGDVTRVDVEVNDVFNNYTTVYTTSTNEFSDEGEWEIVWDTTELRHDAEYLLRIRSYDGLDYSSWVEVLITADNPPNANNNQPVFDPSGWRSEITLYCDTESKSVDKCTTAEIDLRDFFEDQDNDIEFISVYNDTAMDDDDMFALVISIGGDGIARYDPADMLFYDEDMQSWTLNNVIFIATDTWASKANSDPVTFTVVPLQFSIQEPEKTWIDGSEIAIYSGLGLPGKQVSVLIAGNPVNTTIVWPNGTWELGIEASRIKDSSTPQFSYGGQYTFVGTITKGEPDQTSTNWSLIGGAFLVAIISLTALAYLSGFIGFEIEDDEEYSKSPVVIPDSGGIDEGSQSEEVENLESYDDHPGWLWDNNAQEWVPDPEYQE